MKRYVFCEHCGTYRTYTVTEEDKEVYGDELRNNPDMLPPRPFPVYYKHETATCDVCHNELNLGYLLVRNSNRRITALLKTPV